MNDRANLSKTVRALAADAERYAEELETYPITTTGPDPLARVRFELAARRRRENLFPPELFGEPAWDMLLDLYVAACSDRRVAISSACIAAAVPATTALRHIKILEQAGLVARQPDSADGRRCFVILTEHATALIERTYSG